MVVPALSATGPAMHLQTRKMLFKPLAGFAKGANSRSLWQQGFCLLSPYKCAMSSSLEVLSLHCCVDMKEQGWRAELEGQTIIIHDQQNNTTSSFTQVCRGGMNPRLTCSSNMGASINSIVVALPGHYIVPPATATCPKTKLDGRAVWLFATLSFQTVMPLWSMR